jgi:hypothetical protein
MGTILHALGISFKDGWGLYEFPYPYSEGISPSSPSSLAQKRTKYLNSWPSEVRASTLFMEELRHIRQQARKDRKLKHLEEDRAWADECRRNLDELRAQPATEDVQKQITLNEELLKAATYKSVMVEQTKKRRADAKALKIERSKVPQYVVEPEEEEGVTPELETQDTPTEEAAPDTSISLHTPLAKLRLKSIDLIPEDSPHHPFAVQAKIKALLAVPPDEETPGRWEWWRSPAGMQHREAYTELASFSSVLKSPELDLVGWAAALKTYYDEYAKLLPQLPDPSYLGKRKFRVPKHLEPALMGGLVVINEDMLPEVSPFAVLAT